MQIHCLIAPVSIMYSLLPQPFITGGWAIHGIVRLTNPTLLTDKAYQTLYNGIGFAFAGKTVVNLTLFATTQDPKYVLESVITSVFSTLLFYIGSTYGDNTAGSTLE